MTFVLLVTVVCLFFFFNDTATTEIYTLSLHDALPISAEMGMKANQLPSMKLSQVAPTETAANTGADSSTTAKDRKSTRLNSSHLVISYAVFCLKKKKHNYTLSPLYAS